MPGSTGCTGDFPVEARQLECIHHAASTELEGSNPPKVSVFGGMKRTLPRTYGGPAVKIFLHYFENLNMHSSPLYDYIEM